MSMAEPWIGDSAYIEWMNAMSSTQVARCGKSVETCLAALRRTDGSFHLGPTIRPWFFLPPRPNVLTAIVLPSRG